MLKKSIIITLILALAITSPAVAAEKFVAQLGTDYPCTFTDNDPESEVFCQSHDFVSTGDSTYFLINVDHDKTLNTSGAIVSGSDSITRSALYDPLGNAKSGTGCTGTISGKCSLNNPILGIWLVDIRGQNIQNNGEFFVSSNFDIYKPHKYHFDTGILQDHIKFYKTYIKTGARQEHLALSANWSDRYSNMELTVITPDAKTKSDISKGDEKVVQTYYLNPGAVAEGSWITQLRAFDARADLDFYSNYDFEYIEEQEIINGIIREKEIKEYPIIIQNSDTPLAMSAIRLEAGDIVKIFSVFGPDGKKRTCTTYTDGCAIKDPQPGIWLVNLQGQTVTGHAPFRLASTHSTYVPEDFEATEMIENRGSVFYYTDIFTENKTHLVTVSSWDDYDPNMETTIISTNLRSAYDQSESDERVAQKAFLVPGDTAEGRWVVQVKSIWKGANVTSKSNYNLTRIPTQSQVSGDLAMGGKGTYYLKVSESKTPLVITLTAFQSGDSFTISSVTGPSGTRAACTQIPSGKESYTCAVKDPPVGDWKIEVSGSSVIGEGPFNLASTFMLTSCGNGICDADENCGTCIKDCRCTQSTCHRNTCMQAPRTVGEKKEWFKDDLDDGLLTQESYDSRLDELAAYDDTKLLSDIAKENEPATEQNQGSDIIETIKSVLFNPLILIVIIALAPVAFVIYKKKKESKAIGSPF